MGAALAVGMLGLAMCRGTSEAQCVGWDGLSIQQLSNSGPPIRALASKDVLGVRTIYAASADNLGVSMVFEGDGLQFHEIAVFRGVVRSLLVHDDGTGPALFAAGDMYERFIDSQNSFPATGVMKYAGGVWSSVGTLRNVNALTVMNTGTGNTLFAGGRFIRDNGGVANRVARWDGSQWRPLVDEVQPLGRTFHAMAYDPARQRTVMFGGRTINSQMLGDTWEWDGALWHQMNVAGPSARMGHAMFYDTSRGKVLLFGGAPGSADATPALADLWEWDGAQWVEITPPSGPPGRVFHGASFDPTRSVLVVNGGETETQFIAIRDTWEWVSATNTWSQRSVIGPWGTLGHGMAFNAANGRTLMFGGMERGNRGRKLWEWNPATGLWALLTDTGPVARAAMCFSPDPISGGFLVYGGGLMSGSEDIVAPYSDMWRWSGTAWTLAPAPPLVARGGAAMVFDSARGRHVLFGGSGSATPSNPRETWTYDGSTWTSMGIGEPDGEVRAMCVHDDGTGPALFITGPFGHCGPLTTYGIAKWTGSAWQALGQEMRLSGNAYFGLASHNDGAGPALLWGAQITDPSGTTSFKAARWRNGTWSDISAGLFSVPEAFVSFSFGGQPTLMCGARGGVDQAGNPVGCLIWNGSSWQLTSGGVRGEGFAMLSPDGPEGTRIVVGGQFNFAGGDPATNLARFGEICDPVLITRHPQNETALGSSPVYFSVQATGTGPLSYQWRRDGVPLSDTVERVHVIGSQTPNLALIGWSLNDVGEYDCVVTGALGPETSQTATLTVPGTSPQGQVGVETLALLPAAAPGYPAGNMWLRYFSPGANVAPDGHATISGYSSGPEIGDRFFATMATAGAAPFEIVADATDMGPAPLGYTYLAFNPNSRAVSYGEYIVTGAMQTHDLLRPVQMIMRINSAGVFSVIAATGLPAVGEGQSFGLILENAAAVGDGGSVAFKAGIIGIAPQPVDGLFYWSREGGLRRVVRVGETLPGSAIPTASFSTNSAVTPAGRLWFVAEGGGGTPVSRLYYWDGAASQQSIGTGDPLPGGENGEVILGLRAPLLTSGETCVTRVEYDDGAGGMGDAVIRASSTGVQVLLRTGDPATAAPEVGATFRSIEPLAANAANMVVLKADTQGPCPACEPASIWLLNDQDVRLVAWRAIRPAGWHPTNAPVRFGHARINARGEVLLSDLDNQAVFGWTQQAGLFTIAGLGTQFEVTPGQFRTVVEASLPTITPDANCIDDEGNAVFTPTMLAGEAALAELRFNDFLTAFRPCPSITRDPPRTFVRAFEQTSLVVAAGGQAGLSYQWRHFGQPLVNGVAPQGDISGAQTDTLIITGTRSAAAGEYDVVVSNGCGAVTSAQATLQVRCFADFNDDGGIDGEDVAAFFARWEAGEESADVSGDGGIDGADVEFFFAAWEAGGC